MNSVFMYRYVRLLGTISPLCALPSIDNDKPPTQLRLSSTLSSVQCVEDLPFTVSTAANLADPQPA